MDKEKKHTYQSNTLGLPPLKMVLVHAENERKNETAQTILELPEAKEKREKATGDQKIDQASKR